MEIVDVENFELSATKQDLLLEVCFEFRRRWFLNIALTNKPEGERLWRRLIRVVDRCLEDGGNNEVSIDRAALYEIEGYLQDHVMRATLYSTVESVWRDSSEQMRNLVAAAKRHQDERSLNGPYGSMDD